MKSLAVLIVLVTMAVPMHGRLAQLLPKPQVAELRVGESPFVLKRAVVLHDETHCMLLKKFLTDNGCRLSRGAKAVVRVVIADSVNGAYDYCLPGFENEAYRLDVSHDSIVIQSVTTIGVIRATQTLAQLAETNTSGRGFIEALHIVDWPAFKLRGWMQDVGRSFLPVKELKREIDLLSRFKVNVFHWHLTEKLAWRFEVKAFPTLTRPENMIRDKGKFYTQAQCRELEAFAHERGVTIIPEIDMPGHSDAFKQAMGFDMQSTQGRKALKTILAEVAETFASAPYIHIGGDEVMIKDDFLEEMTAFVRDSLRRRVVLWNRLRNKAVTSDIADMTQMWATSGKAIPGLPNIDCRYNYTNHFDVYADLVGIYKSNIYYARRGNPDLAGTISAAWNDTKLPATKDIIKQNNQYANILASTERAWRGGGRQYIEKGGTTLPDSGMEFNEFADFERRLLFHKSHSLRHVPIAYVKQTNVHWRISDPFPNDGDAEKTFPPEQNTDSVLPAKFVYKNKTYGTRLATGAGIYLRHIWHPTVPSFYSNPSNNQTAYAWTYVYSSKRQKVGAQIEFYTYSRSGDELAPPQNRWDRRGSRIWVNGRELTTPVWRQPDSAITQDHATKGLTNENLTARKPTVVHLEKGWNKVLLKLPHVNNGGTGRDKWQFTFVLTDPAGRNALENVVYSPDRINPDSVVRP